MVGGEAGVGISVGLRAEGHIAEGILAVQRVFV